MAWLIISIAILMAILLGIVLYAGLVSRGNEKRKREEDLKPKRDDNDRLILDEDGELIDFPLQDAEDEHAQRSRHS